MLLSTTICSQRKVIKVDFSLWHIKYFMKLVTNYEAWNLAPKWLPTQFSGSLSPTFLILVERKWPAVSKVLHHFSGLYSSPPSVKSRQHFQYQRYVSQMKLMSGLTV